MPDKQPKAWLCKHCGERVDPTMDLCWACGHDRQGREAVDYAADNPQPFNRCPECHYDLRGNLEATACPECGLALTLSDVHQQLYWVPSSTRIGKAAMLLRNPLRMMPVALFAWLLFGLAYMENEETYFFVRGFRDAGPAEYILFLSFCVSLFFTFAVVGGILVQGLQPPDETKTESSLTTGNGFILRWMRRGWGRYLHWIAWALLLISILLFYGT